MGRREKKREEAAMATERTAKEVSSSS